MIIIIIIIEIISVLFSKKNKIIKKKYFLHFINELLQNFTTKFIITFNLGLKLTKHKTKVMK